MGETHWCHRRCCLHRRRRCCCCCRHHRCYDWCRRWCPRHLLKSTIHRAGILLLPSRRWWKCPWHFLSRKRRSHHPRSLHRLRPDPHEGESRGPHRRSGTHRPQIKCLSPTPLRPNAEEREPHMKLLGRTPALPPWRFRSQKR
jgi:hypothetical protein